jgi:hypothetical protein
MLVAGAYIFEKNLAKHAELIQHAHAAGWQCGKLAGLGCRDASREKKKMENGPVARVNRKTKKQRPCKCN